MKSESSSTVMPSMASRSWSWVIVAIGVVPFVSTWVRVDGSGLRARAPALALIAAPRHRVREVAQRRREERRHGGQRRRDPAGELCQEHLARRKGGEAGDGLGVE